MKFGAARRALGALPLMFCACATPGAPRAYFLEDAYARYYADASGRTLRVEHDGSVHDVTCLPLEVVKEKPLASLPKSACPNSEIPVLGKTRRSGDDWDMTGYEVERSSGRCLPLFDAPTGFDDQDARPRRSCWNRLWEVPTAIVVIPVVVVVALGAVTAPIWAPILFLR